MGEPVRIADVARRLAEQVAGRRRDRLHRAAPGREAARGAARRPTRPTCGRTTRSSARCPCAAARSVHHANQRCTSPASARCLRAVVGPIAHDHGRPRARCAGGHERRVGCHRGHRPRPADLHAWSASWPTTCPTSAASRAGPPTWGPWRSSTTSTRCSCSPSVGRRRGGSCSTRFGGRRAEFATIVHPDARLGTGVEVGEGTVVSPALAARSSGSAGMSV